MPASSPDASFTLEGLLGKGNDAGINPMPSQYAEMNGHAANGTPANNYGTPLDDDNSDVGRPHDEYIRGVEDDEEEGFAYTSDDAPEPLDYNAKLANTLGVDSSSGVLGIASDRGSQEASYQSAGLGDRLNFPKLQPVADAQSPSPSIDSPHSKALAIPGQSFAPPVRPPFLHPSVSRLRSFIPYHRTRISSSSTFQTSYSQAPSPEPSHFSAISRAPSVSAPLENKVPEVSCTVASPPLSVSGVPGLFEQWEVFRWTTLRQISSQIYSSFSSKAAVILDTHMGKPTVIAAGGLLCIGTDTGRTYVFDFKQKFKFVCEPETPADAGPVTAFALSQDHTFLAIGHALGHIFLYDLAKPQAPARAVPPADLESIAASRKEGHLFGSKIIHLGFVGARHTAIVSADDVGLAFYHSLGKVLFIEANDVIRILGNYPEDDFHPVAHTLNFAPSGQPSAQSRRLLRRHKKTNSILAMMALPIATSPYPTDAFNIIALLTPLKLVIVGLKPSPNTWYRRHRSQDDDYVEQSTWRGCLAWFPSTPKDGSSQAQSAAKTSRKVPKLDIDLLKTPILAYSWGRTITLLRVRAENLVSRPDDSRNAAGIFHTLVFEEAGEMTADADILALQWLNAEQLLAMTVTHVAVYDVHSLKLVDASPSSPSEFASCLSHSGHSPRPPTSSDPGDSLRPSLDVYKGKIFLLGGNSIRVGTLISWADRILFLVESGDFLAAIDLTRAYYLGEAPGNTAGLPADRDHMRAVVGRKIRELMTASAQYAFSEDRMTDSTHYSADGRGVDRTPLFEGLVTTVIRASIALNDYDFLFDELYDMYDDHGIVAIFLRQLQEAVLADDLRTIPPRISKKVIEYHDSRGSFDVAEQLVWHIDPSCLDIDQVIVLCQKHYLYDALIYVYTRALRDYVSPLVELLGLIRKIQQTRRQRPARIRDTPDPDAMNIERLVPNAYKAYSYIADVLSGLTHPSQEPMPESEAVQAKSDIYNFLFAGRSSVWQGRLVLTSDDENGSEPTFSYLRLLARFDAEATLHALDQALEDSFLNDSYGPVSRQQIIEALLELAQAKDLSPNDITFLRIFVARNAPKYPQFIKLSPEITRNTLIGLASDVDQSTREDRQLATEILLSVYVLQDDADLLRLFEEAEFFRILRAFNRQEKRWGALIAMYLRDDELAEDDLFAGIERVLLSSSSSSRRGKLIASDIYDTIVSGLPTLLESNVTQTAMLVDRRVPELHDQALLCLRQNAPSKELGYLWSLIKGVSPEIEAVAALPLPSQHLSPDARLRFVALLCESDPSQVRPTLAVLPRDYFDLSNVVDLCEKAQVHDAVIWALNEQGDIPQVFAWADATFMGQAAIIATKLTSGGSVTSKEIDRLQSLGHVLTEICSERSSLDTSTGMPADEMWFKLLSSQISAVQAISSVVGEPVDGNTSTTVNTANIAPLERLRLSIQQTFSTLVQQSSSNQLSFPRLFKQLVDASSSAKYGRKTTYTEFRLILGGMLDSYRAEEDVLMITKRLAEQDLFESIADYTAARKRGMRMHLNG